MLGISCIRTGSRPRLEGGRYAAPSTALRAPTSPPLPASTQVVMPWLRACSAAVTMSEPTSSAEYGSR